MLIGVNQEGKSMQILLQLMGSGTSSCLPTFKKGMREGCKQENEK